MFWTLLRAFANLWWLGLLTLSFIVASLFIPIFWGMAAALLLVFILDIHEFVTVTLPLAAEQERYVPRHGES